MKRNKLLLIIFTLVLVPFIYLMLAFAYYLDIINGYLFVGLLIFGLGVSLVPLVIFRNDRNKRSRIQLITILLILLLVYEFRLIHYEANTYLATTYAEPIEVVKDSGIHIMVVNQFDIYYLEDEKSIIKSYEGQSEPVNGLDKVKNQDRYRSKNSEILKFLRIKKEDFDSMGENVTRYLEDNVVIVDEFLRRNDLSGNSFGLGLALTGLIEQGKLKNGLDIGVTGALGATGDVFGVGSVREKLLFAEQNGLSFVLVPGANVEEAELAKKEFKLNLNIYPVNHIDQAVEVIKWLQKDIDK